MKKLTLLSLFLSFTTLAQVQIQIVDPDVDPASFEGSGYKVETKERSYSAIPNLEKREALFEGVILPKKWDELDKDMFYIDLKSKSLEKLEIKYPEIPVKTIKQLKAKRG